LTAYCLQLCFDYTIIFILKNSTCMGWHLKWVDMLTNLVSVRHWPLMGVDSQNVFKNKIKPKWRVVVNSILPWHYATSSQLLHYFGDLVFEWMKEGYWWMKYWMHFQLYFKFNYHCLYPTHILPTHLPTYHYLHPMYMLSTYYCNLYLQITHLPT
jgi:hypothetical protein